MTELKDKIYYLIERYEEAKERGDRLFKEEGNEECRRMLVNAILGYARCEMDLKK